MNIYNGIKTYIKNKLTAKQWSKLKKIKIISKYFKYIDASPKNYLSIVAIIKNEAPYIAEWLEYHLLMGVNKFYIYDNESEDNLEEILQPYIKNGVVEYVYCPGKGKQMWAYNDILKTARKETYWLAVIDCDEFIVPISTESIPKVLKEFEGYGGLGINWLMYGSSGQKNKTDGLVIERFKYHSIKDFRGNECIKTIIMPRYVISINHPHYANYMTGKFCVNTDKEKINGPFNPHILYDKIRINHYFVKSYDEYLQKRQRGRASYSNGETRSIEEFYDHDRNEEHDIIMDKYIPVIYKKLQERYG